MISRPPSAYMCRVCPRASNAACFCLFSNMLDPAIYRERAEKVVVPMFLSVPSSLCCVSNSARSYKTKGTIFAHDRAVCKSSLQGDQTETGEKLRSPNLKLSYFADHVTPRRDLGHRRQHDFKYERTSHESVKSRSWLAAEDIRAKSYCQAGCYGSHGSLCPREAKVSSLLPDWSFDA